MALHHVNFHTLRSMPVFEQQEYDVAIRAMLADVLQRHAIMCPVWEVMPTHVHLIVKDFDDFPRTQIVQRIKGASAHAFFQQYPHLRADLLGGHLWSKGYYAVLITSHRHYRATVDYIQNNRARAGLQPPTPLQYVEG